MFYVNWPMLVIGLLLWMYGMASYLRIKYPKIESDEHDSLEKLIDKGGS